MSPPRAAWRIFLTCWLIYALHFASNMVREIFPALSLGDQFSLRVDAYANLHPDLFETPGYGWHINSNPGASMLAAVPYATARPLIDRIVDRVNRGRGNRGATPPKYESPWPMARAFFEESWRRGFDVKFGLAALVIQVFCMAPLSAAIVVLMFLVLRRLDIAERSAVMLSLLFAFGTPLFFRTGTLNHNLLAGHFAFAGFVVLWNPRGLLRWSLRRVAVVAGAAAGACILMDYSGVVLALGLGWYLLHSTRSARPVTWFLAGALLPLSLLWVAQWQSFGHPFYPAQHWMPRVAFSNEGYNGFSLPQLDLILQNGFDYRFGLFTSAPLLLLAFAAPWLGSRSKLARRQLVFFLGTVAGLWLFASCVQYARLQFNTGVRYLAPSFALLFVPAALSFLRLPPIVQGLVATVAITESWCLAMYRDVERGMGLLEPMIHVFTEGLQLPFLTVLSRMRGQYGNYFAPGTTPLVLFLLVAAILFVIWRPYVRYSGKHVVNRVMREGRLVDSVQN